MKIRHQSPALAEVFRSTVEDKVIQKQQAIQESLGNGFMGMIGAGVFRFQERKNRTKGYIGETLTSSLLTSFPDSWLMFHNAFIPASHNKLTEIDLLIIGDTGIFLIEVKNWKGSFAAYRDKWKRRDGDKWIPLENSPTLQSVYHQNMFRQWILPQVPGLPQDFITAPVIFPIAKWIGVTDCSVPVLKGLGDLVPMLRQSPNRLTPEQVLKISEVVENYDLAPTPKSPPKPKPILRKDIQKS